MAAVDPPQFNPHLREQQLRTEADGWDVADPEQAVAEDLTVIDVSGWKPTLGLRPAPIANAVRDACERVGFFQITGHGLSSRIIEQATSMNRAFHALPLETKMSIAMDQPGAIGGVGYLPIGHNKLPKRAVGNRNAAFIVKTSADLMADDNLWPTEAELPGFRRAVTDYLTAISDLAMQVVTLYEAALGLDPGFLDTAFTGPLARLRFSHYPPGEWDAPVSGATWG